MKKSELRRAIYLECKNACTFSDTDNIKQMRDDISNKHFGVSEPELDDNQRAEFFRILKSNRPKASIATRRQCNYVRELAFEFAVLYHDFSNSMYTNKLGVLMNPDNVKLMVQEQYKKDGFLGIDSWLRNVLYEQTANPKCNDLLDRNQWEGADKSKFYYDRMTYSEADKLIKRFLKILNKANRIKRMGKPNNYSNN